MCWHSVQRHVTVGLAVCVLMQHVQYLQMVYWILLVCLLPFYLHNLESTETKEYRLEIPGCLHKFIIKCDIIVI